MTPEDLFRTFQRDQTNAAIAAVDWQPIMKLILDAFRAAASEGATPSEAAILSGLLFRELMDQARRQGGETP